MSTHAILNVRDITDPDLFWQVYVHFDGYPDGVGHMLLHHYQDLDKVQQLVKLGDLSYLGKTPDASPWTIKYGLPFNTNDAFKALPKEEQKRLHRADMDQNYTFAYGRDRQEENTQATKISRLVLEHKLNQFADDVIYKVDFDYWYVFEPDENGNWYWRYFN